MKISDNAEENFSLVQNTMCLKNRGIHKIVNSKGKRSDKKAVCCTVLWKKLNFHSNKIQNYLRNFVAHGPNKQTYGRLSCK